MTSLLPWLAANKDGIIALGALISPVTALLASAVSYWAVVTGPRIQRAIARDQFVQASKQLALQERTVALTEAQISANLLGAADQKWIEDLRQTIADLEGVITERGVITDTQKRTGLPYQNRRGSELSHRLDPLITKIRLMVGPTNKDLLQAAWNWATAQDVESRLEAGDQVVGLVWLLIEQKQTGITARLAAIGASDTNDPPVASSMPPKSGASGS